MPRKGCSQPGSWQGAPKGAARGCQHQGSVAILCPQHPQVVFSLHVSSQHPGLCRASRRRSLVAEKSRWEGDLKPGACFAPLSPSPASLWLSVVVLQVIACKLSAPGIDTAQLGTVTTNQLGRNCWSCLQEQTRASCTLPNAASPAGGSSWEG